MVISTARIISGKPRVSSTHGTSKNTVNISSTGGPPRIKERAVNVESEYDYGARAGVWRLFRLFNKHGMKFTLYAVGKALEDNPAVGRSCVENGHDVASHAYR